MRLRLLTDVSVCSACGAEVVLTPHYTESPWFAVMVLVASILLGHALGWLRVMNRSTYDWRELVSDLAIYFALFWLVRLVLFRFQRIEAVPGVAQATKR